MLQFKYEWLDDLIYYLNFLLISLQTCSFLISHTILHYIHELLIKFAHCSVVCYEKSLICFSKPTNLDIHTSQFLVQNYHCRRSQHTLQGPQIKLWLSEAINEMPKRQCRRRLCSFEFSFHSIPFKHSFERADSSELLNITDR